MNTIYSVDFDGNKHEIERLQQLEAAISKSSPSQVKLDFAGGTSLPLTNALYELLLEALAIMRKGEGLSLMAVSREVTTTQAAEILNISRPYLAKLLDKGAIPSHRVGTHRRIFLADILAYQNQRHAQVKEGLQNLADFSQECGLYAIDYKPEP